MESNNPLIQEYYSQLKSIGKSAMSTLYPNDFEMYMIFFELVDSSKPEKLVEYFSFPIMPDSISEAKENIVNIKKTAGGITTMGVDTFKPIRISLSGSFGRKFKFLLGRTLIDASALSMSTASGFYNPNANVKQAMFNKQIKTGYGCIKILESIYKKTNTLDESGNPYKLYFYNPALGNHYQVKMNNLTLNQSMDSNMIWNYNLSMTAVAPLAGVRNIEGRNSLLKATGFKALNEVATKTTSLLYKELTKGVLSKIKIV